MAEDPPLPVQAGRLLAHVRREQVDSARRLLAHYPELASYHFLSAGVVGRFESGAELPLEAGAEPDTSPAGAEGETPGPPLTALCSASLNDRVEIVRCLVAAHSGLVPGLSADGRSGLVEAALAGRHEALNLMAAHGSVNARDADDGYESVVDRLLDAGHDRAATCQRWNEPPEALAMPRVAALLRAGGLAPPIG